MGTEIRAQSPPAAPAAGVKKAPPGQDDPATAKDQPEPAVYCTLLICEKLQADLKVTDKERAELAKLQEHLKASILGGGVHAQQHGPSTGKARTLAKMTEVALAYVGKKVKDVLTAEQDATLRGLYASGKLRPIEVAAAELHDRTHPINGASFGRIYLVPHYDDSAGSDRAASGSATQGAVRGTHNEGSYYHESAAPAPRAAAGQDRRQDNLGSAENIDALLADLKPGPVLNTSKYDYFMRALVQLERMAPKEPNPKVARALETVLQQNSSVNVRVLAVNALGNWGTPESIPVLKKVAEAPDAGVAVRAQKAIEKLGGGPAPGKHAAKSRPLRDTSALVADLRSSLHRVRVEAIVELDRRKPTEPDPAVAAALELALLEDEDTFMRSTAAEALGSWGSPESIPALEKALKDPSPVVQSRAKKAIATLSSRQ
jgi:hypothetical protein